MSPKCRKPFRSYFYKLLPVASNMHLIKKMLMTCSIFINPKGINMTNIKNKTMASNGGKSSGGRGQSSHPGPGGNWPSTTPGKSGGGRGNAVPKGK
jgi:hypothetical protein